MCFVVVSFITNPVLTAASVICVTTTSVTFTDHRSVNTSSAYAVHCLVPLKIVPVG